MAVSSMSLDLSQPHPQIETEYWYGLQTRPRHEKIVAHRLEERGVTTFLPLVTEVHRWSDRKKTVQVPLFGCYVFAKFIPNRMDRLRVLRVDGVFGLVGSKGEGTPIPDQQIDAVRSLVETQMPWSSHPFLKIGQRVRVTQRRSGRPRRHTRLAQWRPLARHFGGCNPEILGSARRRIRSRTCLTLSRCPV